RGVALALVDLGVGLGPRAAMRVGAGRRRRATLGLAVRRARQVGAGFLPFAIGLGTVRGRAHVVGPGVRRGATGEGDRQPDREDGEAHRHRPPRRADAGRPAPPSVSTTRRRKSVSVTTPTRASASSRTGSAPILLSMRIAAASRASVPGATETTSRVITS